jgi:uncharacterized protein YndB with AHSA1/START domain
MPKSDPSAKLDPGDAIARARLAMSEFGVVPEARALRIRRVLPGPIERVWAFLTEAEKRAKWLAAGPMELHAGGQVALHFRHADLAAPAEPVPDQFKKHEAGHRLDGRIIRCEPPRLLSYTWDEASGHESEVTFELTPEGRDVVLVLTHRLLPDRATMLGVATGWHAHLGILVDHLSGREPQPFWSTYAALRTEYDRRLPAD